MVKRVSENPLIYEDEEGKRLTAEKVICPKHKNEIWFIRSGGDIIPVKTQIIEFSCAAWKNAVEEGQA